MLSQKTLEPVNMLHGEECLSVQENALDNEALTREHARRAPGLECIRRSSYSLLKLCTSSLWHTRKQCLGGLYEMYDINSLPFWSRA